VASPGFCSRWCSAGGESLGTDLFCSIVGGEPKGGKDVTAELLARLQPKAATGIGTSNPKT